MRIGCFDLFACILFAPEDGTGGGAANAGGDAASAGAGATGADAAAVAAAGAVDLNRAAANAAAASGQGQGQGQQASSIFKVDGLGDHLYGATDQETITKLANAYKGARDAIAKAGEAPKDVASYTFEPTDKLKGYADNLATDPFFDATKSVALEAGLTPKQFQTFVSRIMETMVDKNIVAEPFSAEKERAALVPDVTDPAARATAADKLIRENLALVNAWKDQGMPEAAVTMLQAQGDRAATHKLIEWIASQRGEVRPALGGNQAGGITEADLNARLADPRNRASGMKYDKAFADETNRMFKAFYGD